MEPKIEIPVQESPLHNSPLMFVFDTASSLTFILCIANDIGHSDEATEEAVAKLTITVFAYPTPDLYPLEVV